MNHCIQLHQASVAETVMVFVDKFCQFVDHAVECTIGEVPSSIKVSVIVGLIFQAQSLAQTLTTEIAHSNTVKVAELVNDIPFQMQSESLIVYFEYHQ